MTLNVISNVIDYIYKVPLPVGSVSQHNLRNSNNYVLPNC